MRPYHQHDARGAGHLETAPQVETGQRLLSLLVKSRPRRITEADGLGRDLRHHGRPDSRQGGRVCLHVQDVVVVEASGREELSAYHEFAAVVDRDALEDGRRHRQAALVLEDGDRDLSLGCLEEGVEHASDVAVCVESGLGHGLLQLTISKSIITRWEKGKLDESGGGSGSGSEWKEWCGFSCWPYGLEH